MPVSSRVLFAVFLLTIMSAFTDNQKKTRVLFFGDSITQMAVQPNGYISELQRILQVQHMDKEVELIGSGISGNKVYDLYLRLENDVLKKKPDVVVIWIGVNDVWHKQLLRTGTDADKFEAFYRGVISKLKERKIDVYVCTPAVIGEKKAGNAMDEELNKYSNIIRKLATTEKLHIIDLRKSFTEYINSNNLSDKDKGILTTDGVHLNDNGNRFVAELMFEYLKASTFKPHK